MEDELPLALVEEDAQGEIAADEGEEKDQAESFEQPAGIDDLGIGVEGVGIGVGRGFGRGRRGGALTRSGRSGTGHGVGWLLLAL